MDIFKGQDVLEFVRQFGSDEDCKKYLSEMKWEQGYECVKCGHTASQTRKDFSKTCNKCSHV